MKITQVVLKAISDSIGDRPPEIGGILGARDGTLIDEVIIDLHSLTSSKLCSYAPDVDFFNYCIEKWQNKGIIFMGIFHTHFFGVKTLSAGDKEYIYAIMNAMPETVNALHFPLFVLPERELVCYSAKRMNGIIQIYCEDTETF